MALKFEIIGNNLVVTDTADNSVKLERPAADVFGVCESDKFKIFTRNQRNDVLLSGDYSNLVDSSDAALTKVTLTTFFRAKLGFSSAGSAAITTISGNFNYGQQLTAVAASGWSLNSWQWTRDGVDINGATNPTYVPVAADIGKSVSVRSTTLPYSAVGGVVSYTGPELLRFATAFNKMPNSSVPVPSSTVDNGSVGKLVGRVYRPIGSGHKKSLRIRVDNCYLNLSDRVANGGTTMTVDGLFVEYNGVSVPVLFNGSPNKTLAAGEFDVLSDKLLPSQFGVTRFPQDAQVYVRGELSAPNGGRFPVTEGKEDNSVAVYYDSALSQCTNLSGTGALTFTGTGRTSTTELPIYVLGEQEDIVADARVWLGYGDSIFAQGGTSSYFQMALRASGGNNGLIAGCACAKVGGTYSFILYAIDEIGSLMKYANGLVEEMHTNSTGLSLSQLQNACISVWSFWRARVSNHPFSRALRIIRVPLGIKTTGPQASQVIDANWDADGKVEQLRDWFPTQVGVAGRIDYFPDDLWEVPNLIRLSASGKDVAGSDYYRWASGKTSDFLHPNITAASPVNGLGANLRTHLLHASNL